MNRDAIVGCILGTAAGDAIGLPYEGLSRRRGARLFGQPDRHRLLLGRGMVSDDTEHTCLVAQSLIAAADDVDAFARGLARRLRLWLLGVPAGVGWATLRATLRLCVGVPPDRSGVFSAGNGPAMRSAVIGAAIDDRDRLRRFVRASTRITHTDPKAEYGALAVALAAQMAGRGKPVEGLEFTHAVREVLSDASADELLAILDETVASALMGRSTPEFAASIDLDKGVSGYVYHTVPVAIHAWLSHPNDFRSAVIDVVRCGGDTDTTGAIVGGLVGAAVGRPGIPPEWLARLCEWPRTVGWMERLADRLHDARSTGTPAEPPRLPAYGLVPRNLFFLLVVLLHGLRRLAPPYYWSLHCQ